jgi:uncharacterized membrane protein
MSEVLAYRTKLYSLTDFTDTYLVERYFRSDKCLWPVIIFGILFAFISFMISVIDLMDMDFRILVLQGTIMWGIFTLGVWVASKFPATLFGSWKGDTYQEKLQWDAFTAFLSDVVRIKNYQSADLSMWGDWLVYGTALGVGKKVRNAIKGLDVSIPEVNVAPGVMSGAVYDLYSPIYSFNPPSSSSGDGGGGDGGGGGGGGGW